jgi:hypothetical protein
MPESTSIVVNLICGDLGEYYARILLDWDKDAPRLAAYSYCKLTAQGYGDSGPAVHAVEMQMTGSVSESGAFTTTRSPTNSSGNPTNHKTVTMKQDLDGNITMSVVLHVKVESDDEDAGFSRVIRGTAWLEYTVVDVTERDGEIDDPETYKSDSIGFGMGVYKG